MIDLADALMQARTQRQLADQGAPPQPSGPLSTPLDPTQKLMEDNADIFNDEYGPLYQKGIHCLAVANGDPDVFAACMETNDPIQRRDYIEEEIENLNKDEWEKRIDPPPAPPGSVGPIT